MPATVIQTPLGSVFSGSVMPSAAQRLPKAPDLDPDSGRRRRAASLAPFGQLHGEHQASALVAEGHDFLNELLAQGLGRVGRTA